MAKKRKDRDGVYWRKDCRKYWFSYVDAKGERQREPGSINWDEARQKLSEALARVKEEKNLKPGELPSCRESFADVADKYLAHQKPRLSEGGYERERGIVNDHLKLFFTDQLADITPAQVSDYVTMRLGSVSKGSVRKELVTLKHLFRLACGEWKLLPRFQNPTLDITAPKVRDERTQHLTADQFRRFLAAAPDKMRPIFALLTATGMRRSELLNCKWGWVQETRILLPTSKNADPKEIHLNAFAQSVLASIPHGEPEDRLFPDVKPAAVSMAFKRVRETLKVSDIRLHDLRHTFATWLRQGGVELDVIAAQLGHRDLRMTKRYARIASAQVSRAVNSLDSVLEGVQKADSGKDRHVSVTLPAERPEPKQLTH